LKFEKKTIHRRTNHCALDFSNGVYDVTGGISPHNFHIASAREICFMKKNYIPAFDTEKLERYIRQTVGEW